MDRRVAAARIRGLVLDRRHRVLVDDQGCAPEATVEWSERPLLAFQDFARDRYGLRLPSPAGSMVPHDGRGPRDFCFFVDPGEALPSMRWVCIAQASSDEWLWRAYVAMVLGGWEPPTRTIDVFAFGAGPEMASRLAHLVTSGSKRVTTSWLTTLERRGEAIPHAGMVSIVTDAFGLPRCAIRTVAVQRFRFGDVPAEWAALEGEGDLTLENWREDHRCFFAGEAESMQLAFSDDEVVLVEKFQVLHVIGRVAER